MRRSRLLTAATATAVLIAVATACHSVSGSGNVVTRQIQTSPFTKLEVSGSFHVSVSVGSSEAVSVRVDDNLVDSLDVGVSGTTLHIGLKSGTSVTNATLQADVTVRSLEALDGSGATTIALSDVLAADTLSVSLFGASRLSGTIDRLTIDLSGASRADVSVTGSLSAGASGASALRYAGSPTISRSETSGASTIEPLM